MTRSQQKKNAKRFLNFVTMPQTLNFYVTHVLIIYNIKVTDRSEIKNIVLENTFHYSKIKKPGKGFKTSMNTPEQKSYRVYVLLSKLPS